MMAQGFAHGVASGEPGANSVLLGTRYAAANDTALTVELSESADFARIAAGGSVTAQGDHDHTAKIAIDGLEPGRWYFYRFVAPDGTTSITGRSEEHTSELQSLMRISYAVFCLKKKNI